MAKSPIPIQIGQKSSNLNSIQAGIGANPIPVSI
jgi:hypothetical protein